MTLTPTHLLIVQTLYINSRWMAWNLMLAIVPLTLAVFLFRPKIRISAWWILGFVTFTLFLPNAPYILTDIIHLPQDLLVFSSQKAQLLTIIQYVLFMSIGYICFAESYRRFDAFVFTKKRKKYRYPFRLAFFALISFGVFLGRTLRFNSWDALIKPGHLAFTVHYLNDLPVVKFIVFFTFILTMLYISYDLVTSRKYKAI